ncbi:MAG: hypothetical protein JNG84_11645, partial [Archangium sp.]|nr:hypothetical protein [Archangium sp.]
MKRAMVMAALVAGSACSPWPPFSGKPRKGLDPRLGLVVTEGHPLRAPRVTTHVTSSRTVVEVYQPAGVNNDVRTVSAASVDFFSVDFGSGTSTQLPRPPLPTAVLRFHMTFDPNALLVSAEKKLAYFDGSSWTALPDFPSSPPGSQELYAFDGQHVVGSSSQVLNGGSWRTIQGGGVIGPVGPRGFRLLGGSVSTATSWPYEMCAPLFDWNGQQQSVTCFDNIDSNEVQPALNGTLDDFQAVVGGVLVHYRNGEWMRGNPAPGTLLPTPGSKKVLVRIESTHFTFGGIIEAEGAEVLRQVSPPLTTTFTGNACADPNDVVECRVTERSVSGEFTPTPDGSAMVLAGWVLSDARLYVTARRYLPNEEDGLLEPLCTNTCAATERCELFATGQMGSIIDKRCVPRNPMLRVGLPPAELTVLLAHSEDAGTNWNVTLTELDGGATTGFTIISPPPELRIRGPQLQPFHLEVTVDEHAPVRYELMVPYRARLAEVGRVPLVRAIPVGVNSVPPNLSGGPGTVLAKSSLVFPLFAEDGGYTWYGVRKSEDGGIERVTLGDGRRAVLTNSQTPAVYASKANRVLIATPTALRAFDPETLEPRGELP